jgi:hypothetical protein
MKLINFMPHTSPRTHYHLLWWKRISLLLMSVTVLVVAAIQFYQLYRWHLARTQYSGVKTETQKYDTQLNELQKLKAEYTSLTASTSQAPASWNKMLSILPFFNHNSSNLTLITLFYTPSDIQMQLQAPTLAALQEGIKELQSRLEDASCAIINVQVTSDKIAGTIKIHFPSS